MKHIDGDLVELTKQGYFDVMAHGCNCMCQMGAGIAKQIKQEFPLAYETDLTTTPGDKNKLGSYSFAEIRLPNHDFTIVNAYTQYHWRRLEGQVNADYNAIRECMAGIKSQFSGSRVGLPLIGAGLAGGDWSRIERIISKELKSEDVTIVHYKPK